MHKNVTFFIHSAFDFLCILPIAIWNVYDKIFTSGGTPQDKYNKKGNTLMNIDINTISIEDAISLLQRYAIFKRQADTAANNAKELAPDAIAIIESGKVEHLKVEGYTATYKIFTDSAIDNYIQYQRESAPSEVVDYDACVAILESMNIPIPKKMKKGSSASIKSKSLKGTAEKRRKEKERA